MENLKAISHDVSVSGLRSCLKFCTAVAEFIGRRIDVLNANSASQSPKVFRVDWRRASQ